MAQAVGAEGVSIAPAEAWSAVLDGRTILELQEGLSLPESLDPELLAALRPE